MKFTKGRFKATSYRPRIHSMMLPDFIRVLWSDDLIVIVHLFYLPWNSSFGGTVRCILSLKEKLEFPSICLWYLVPYWIHQEKLSALYTNSSLSIVMNVRPYAIFSHACRCTEIKPNQAGSGSGGVRLRLADTNAAPFKGLLNLLHFEFFYFSELTPNFWAK